MTEKTIEAKNEDTHQRYSYGANSQAIPVIQSFFEWAILWFIINKRHFQWLSEMKEWMNTVAFFGFHFSKIKINGQWTQLPTTINSCATSSFSKIPIESDFVKTINVIEQGSSSYIVSCISKSYEGFDWKKKKMVEWLMLNE